MVKTPLLLFLLALGGCSSVKETTCPTIAYAGLNVVVIDAKTGARICDAVVTAKDGSYTEKLMALGPGPQCGYAGAYERAGTYTITVEHGGYKASTSPALTVGITTGDCPHVEQKSLTVALDPAP